MKLKNLGLTDFKINSVNNKLLSQVDLHLHTYWSDGEISPKELIEQISGLPCRLVSITDHNSIEAYTPELFEECRRLNINILPGVEVDCGSGLDILVYDKNPNEISQEFKDAFEKITKRENLKRVEVAKKCLGEIKKYFGIKNELLTVDNLFKIDLKTGEFNLDRTYLSKPHIAKLLDMSGLLKDKFDNLKDIYKFVFNKVVKWDYDNCAIDIDLIKEIQKLGFTMILAHPGKTIKDVYKNKELSKELFLKFLKEMILELGLDGAEVDYRGYRITEIDFNKITMEFLKNINNKKNYFGTAGSDRH